MSEIMDFVSYHLKQVGLDSRSLNGGIILTGGGSQMKHLLQLTEYLTGLNARIGLPNEHLAGDYLEELAMPMYSTCIGLILKGYNDYENTVRAAEIVVEKEVTARKVVVVDNQVEIVPAVDETLLTEAKVETTEAEPVEVKPRKKTIKDFMDSIKNNLIEMFQEEGDTKF